ncbi:hypothetical protein FQN54_008238 [Arachnomyces sp. PD_36]|nr:hypothetical protein FQN54_008238 [Arachnomyces sp. PD_36]
MEVAAIQPSDQHHPPQDTMDNSMDIDMDIDLGPLPEPEAIEAEPTSNPPATVDGANATEAAIEDTLAEDAQFEKVHIRGVDELTTDDIKRFATDHFIAEQPSKIEWIDDTSANIVYSSSEIGLQALAAFTQKADEDASTPSLRLRVANTLSTHPDSVLQVRSAVKTDRKKPRAHEASRFYMMHPEHDPRERIRREFSERRGKGGRDESDGDYRRRRFDDKEHRRRRERSGKQDFSANMYDEAPESDFSGSRRRGSSDSDRDGDLSMSDRGRRARAELFPDHGSSSRRLRDRSASPGSEGLHQMGDSDEERRNSRRRFRNRSPHVPYNDRNNDRVAHSNARKELFPFKKQVNGNGNTSPSRELFPDTNKSPASYLKKELFPVKGSPNHHRSNAFDAADETADLFADRMAVPLVDGANEANDGSRRSNVELFPDSEKKGGFSIRGAASQDQGMSIRGTGGLSIKGSASVKELFPSKYSGKSGKDLFSDKLEGRGNQRRKAEDMFY